nr:transglutaminase-like domain-containing protein [Lysobacter ruishenii]
MIDAAVGLASPLDARVLAFQRERMRRIQLDFNQDAAQVRDGVRRRIPDLRDEEFSRWDAQGLLERMDIDGERRYFNRTASNLFRVSAEARARRAEQTPFVESPFAEPHRHHAEVVAATRRGQADSVLPRRWKITQSLTVNADAVPDGEVIRAWIPFPREIPGQQEGVRLLASVPVGHRIAPVDALQRTVYMEQPAERGQATRFSVSYEITLSARRFEVDPVKVGDAALSSGLSPFLAERAPHVVFTNELKAFSRGVVGSETDPWTIARRLYDAVDRIPWAGAREYSTISNISDYALHAGHADCGQQTLLLITLLRLNGIPARWQSGMMFGEDGGGRGRGYWNLHDWGQLYIAPYGWIPFDVTFGRLDDPDAAVAGFYLGGIDGHRIAFNDDYGRALVPSKQHFRSETVDLQRGEAEWRGGNLYFDQWDYDFIVEPIPFNAMTTLSGENP